MNNGPTVSVVSILLLLLAAAVLAEEPAPPPRRSLSDIIENLPFGLNGFFEARAGTRTQSDRHISKTATIAETRLQLEITKVFEIGDFAPELRIKGDLLYDGVMANTKADLREAYVLFSPLETVDLKIGRQVLTWGTGDLLFINDLFPKDWVSFFIGRDDEYLKAPSDAVRVSYYGDWANVDLVYTARFRPDEYVTGERLSYWSDALGRRAGEDNTVADEVPEDWFSDDEFALRIFRNIRGYEFALYAYRGYWPTPAGMDPTTFDATFPQLSVYGASFRGPVLKGIGNVEFGYYDSRDDRSGDDPLVRNSELRLLVGYEQEIGHDFTAGLQYYLEWMMDYDDYHRTLPPGIHSRDQLRHVLTLRLTKLLMNQNLTLSFFAYYSPSDSDAYLRPKVHYKVSDHWAAEVGANIFLGSRDHTFFGMFERDTNVYCGARYSF